MNLIPGDAIAASIWRTDDAAYLRVAVGEDECVWYQATMSGWSADCCAEKLEASYMEATK